MKSKYAFFRLTVFALAAMLVLPLAGFAQGRGRGHGRDKKQDVFVNGHDARDGRLDGRGPQRDRTRYDDDDDDYDRDGRYNRNRRSNRDGRYNGGDVNRIARDNGYRAGYDAGRRDRADGDRFNYRDEGAYRDATYGYRSEYGNRDAYRNLFRSAFAQGYEDGYGNRNTRGSGGWGGILGDVIGRP
jgi:hypothetical protein